MKGLILSLLTIVLLSSCSSYNRIQGDRITHVLAVTEKGDTVKVPASELNRNAQPNYYDNWQFFWRNNWYWGNVWYPYYYIPYRQNYWNNWYWRRTPIIINPTPRFQSPRRVTPSEPRRYYTPTPQQPRTQPSQPNRAPIREFNPPRSTNPPQIRREPIRGGGIEKRDVIRQNEKRE